MATRVAGRAARPTPPPSPAEGRAETPPVASGNRPGRPTVKPDEPSLTLPAVTVERSLYHRLRLVAQHQQIPLSELVRKVLRGFISEKLSAR